MIGCLLALNVLGVTNSVQELVQQIRVQENDKSVPEWIYKTADTVGKLYAEWSSKVQYDGPCSRGIGPSGPRGQKS